MRKVILFVASSLDGYLAGPKGEIDWLFHDQDYGYKRFYDSIDTLLIGRKTYEQALGFGEWPYPRKTCYVFTKNKKLKDNRVIFSDDPIRITKELLSRKGKNIWLVGGAQIISILLNAGLVDRLMIFIHPIILGAGIPLFTRLKRIGLEARGSKRFAGLVEIDYAISANSKRHK